MQAAVREERSIGQLLKELRDETTTLLRQEVDLAKTEMGEKAARVGTNLGALAVGGGVALLGALALLAAVVYGLTSLLSQFLPVGVAIWLAPLIVGLVLAFLGYGQIQKALATLRQESLTPRKTTQTLQENKEWLKARMQ
jgi:putative Mn2+ efflux pump MntP